ncbi:MAG TPA: PIG-L family deacetylase [Acidimicrobiales bacterium]
MKSLPTLICVHAHPDDEAFFGGGASAHYAALGHRVVLITCTSGQLGFDGAGRSGDQLGHDARQTKVTRAGELQESAAILGIARVVNLGYDDSGMKGWPENEAPNAFANKDVAAVARTIASIMDEEHAAVVVTYDESGFYGHPDHVKANEVTRAAVAISSSVERLYYSVVPEGVITSLVAGATALNLAMPSWVTDAGTHVHDDLVSTTLDVSNHVKIKHDSMAAHGTQIDNEDLVEMNADLFSLLFSTEYYQRAWSRHQTSDDRTDLMGGL